MKTSRVVPLAALLLSAGISTANAATAPATVRVNAADGTWTDSAGAVPSPSPRAGSAVVLDSRRHRVLLFGGQQSPFSLYGPNGWDVVVDNDLWSYSLDTHTWTQLVTSGYATPRCHAAAVYDSLNDRLVVFGGETGWCGMSTGHDPYYSCRLLALGDAQILSLTTMTWTSLYANAPNGTPPAAAANGVFDPVRQRMIVTESADNAAWELSLDAAPTWRKLAIGQTAPSQRSGAAVAYDPLARRMLLFGGELLAPRYNDTWALSLDGIETWSQISATNPPPVRANAAAVFDVAHNRLVVFGGEYGNNSPSEMDYNDTWALDFAGAAAWTQLAPAGTPPSGRYDIRAVYDPAAPSLTGFGGHVGDTGFSDTWSLSFPGSTRATAPVVQAVSPAILLAGAPATVTVTGRNFAAGDVLTLQGPAGTSVTIPSPQILNATTLTASVTIPGADFGAWKTIVTDASNAADTLTGAPLVAHGATMSVSAPAGGMQQNTTSPIAVAWHTALSPGDPAPTQIVLASSVDAGRTFSTIATLAPTESTYTWSPAPFAADSVVVRVSLNAQLGGIGSAQTGIFPAGYAPAVSVVSPTIVPQLAHRILTVTGAPFAPGMRAWLSRAGSPDAPASALTLAPTLATFDIDCRAVANGWWAVTIENPGGFRATLQHAVRVMQAPSVTLTAPNGGESMLTGTSFSIAWAPVAGDTAFAFHELRGSTDGGATYPYLLATPAGGATSYLWPVNMPATTAARIQVTSYDALGNIASDASNASFTISEPPALASIAPTRVAAGALVTLTLSGGHFTSGGSAWLTQPGQPPVFATATTYMSSVQYTASFAIPSAAHGAWTVTLQLPGVRTDSLTNALTVVRPPAVIVRAPNGGQTYSGGTVQTATWTLVPGDDAIDHCAIDLSSNAGASFGTPLGTTVGRDSSLAWTVPSFTSNTCLVRVTAFDANGFSAFDVSDAPFTIQLQSLTDPLITAVTPGSALRGTTLTLGVKGARFTGPLDLHIELSGQRVNLTNTHLVSADSMYGTLTLPSNATPGAYDVVEQNTDGHSTRLVAGFRVSAPVDLQSLAPDVLPTSNGATTTLSGLYFEPGSTVWLTAKNTPPVYATRVDYISDQTLQVYFNLAGQATTLRTITVQTPSGTRDSLKSAVTLQTPPQAHLTSPNGGEHVFAGSPTLVLFSAQPTVSDLDHLDLDYSADGGATWTPIVQGLAPDDASYIWTPPLVSSATSRLRITAYDLDGVPGSDTSDGDFLIDAGTAARGSGDTPGSTPQVFAVHRVAAAGMQWRVSVPRAGRFVAAVFDVAGGRIATLAQPAMTAAGERTLSWDGRRADGAAAPAGLYFLRVGLEGESRVTRVLRMR